MVSLPPSRRCCSSSRMSFPSDFVIWASFPLLAKSCHHPAWIQLHVNYPSNSTSAPWPPAPSGYQSYTTHSHSHNPSCATTHDSLTSINLNSHEPAVLLFPPLAHLPPLLCASRHLSGDMFSALGPLSSPRLSEAHHSDHGSRAIILLSSSRRVFLQTLKFKWTENSILLALHTSCWITAVKNSAAESGLVHDHSCQPQLDFSCHPALHLVTWRPSFPLPTRVVSMLPSSPSTSYPSSAQDLLCVRYKIAMTW